MDLLSELPRAPGFTEMMAPEKHVFKKAWEKLANWNATKREAWFFFKEGQKVYHKNLSARDKALAEKDAFIDEAIEALEYYAKGEHYDGDWDTVSGEPPNLLCLAETDEWHWIESGAVAKQTLQKLREHRK